MIEKNRSIYTLNRGGVTLTGGEPLFQPDFVIELLRQLPDIHTAIETSGYANTHIFNEVTSLADLILFDIKHTDPEMHRKYTGVDNAIILENLALLCNSGRDFIIRIPLIPGVNDTRENMSAILEKSKMPGTWYVSKSLDITVQQVPNTQWSEKRIILRSIPERRHKSIMYLKKIISKI